MATESRPAVHVKPPCTTPPHSGLQPACHNPLRGLQEDDGGAPADPENDLFALRYSVRQRRQVERFNPVEALGSQPQAPTDSGAAHSRKRRDREDGKAAGGRFEGESDEVRGWVGGWV